MVAELLRLRFEEPATKAKIESTDTALKKALAWQHVASLLSQSIGVVVRDDQVSQKYRKLKCIYQREKRELLATGNNSRQPIDQQLWEIWNDAFGSRPGINGNVLTDTDMATEDDANDSDSNKTASTDDAQAASAHGPPIVQIAAVLQTGMMAIASSLSGNTASNTSFDTLAAQLKQQHEESLRVQAAELQLLQQLLLQIESQG